MKILRGVFLYFFNYGRYAAVQHTAHYTNDVSVHCTLRNIVWRLLQILRCAAPLRNEEIIKAHFRLNYFSVRIAIF